MAADGSVIIEIIGDADDITNELKNIKNIANEAASNVSKALQKISDSLLRINQSASQIANSMRGISEGAQSGENLFDNVEESANSAEDALEDVTNELENIEDSADVAEDSLDDVTEQLEDFEDAANGADDSTEDLTDDLDDIGESAQKAQAGLSIATAAIVAASAALTAFVANSIKAGMEFDSSMSQVAATMGLSAAEIQTGSEEFELLSNAAKEAGATTAFSASQASQALNYLALAGYDAATSVEVLPSVLNLAAAGGMDLAYASDLATDAMAALGIEASKANLETFGDQLAAAASNANASVSQLGEAILVVGGTAKSLAGGTTELNAALGVLANRGIKGAEGGTALRNIILSLSAPTDKAARLMKRLGVEIYDAEGNMRPLNKAFKDLSAAMQGMTEGEKTEVLNEIFNKVDLKSAQALLAGTGEEFDALAIAIENSAGAMQDMADVQLDNLAGDMTKLGSATEAAQIALSDALTPALRGVTQAGTGIISFLGSAIADFPILGDLIGGITAGLGVMAIGLGTTGIAALLTAGEVTTLTGAVTALGAALTATPLGPIALAVGLGVTAFTALAGAANDAAQEVDTFQESMDESRGKYESSANAIKAQNDEIMTMIGTLESLAEKENKTSAEKEALASMVRELNELVPELNLNYNSLNDTLSMTAEQIREVALAQSEQEEKAAAVERLKDAYVEQEEIAKRLKRAQEELNRATEAYDAIGTDGITRTREEIAAAQKAYENAVDAVEELTEEYEAHTEEVKKLEGQYNDLDSRLKDITGSTFKDLISTLKQSTDAVSDEIDEYEDLLTAAEALDNATQFLTDAQDALTSALKEQEEAGGLSLATTQSLIDAGYGAALAIDEETGAVTINESAYKTLAEAKINDQIASLESRRASAQNLKSYSEEQAELHKLTNEYLSAAFAKDAMKQGKEIDAINAEIDALNKAKDRLNSYSGAVKTAARSSSSASKKIKTQAEQDLETYKNLKAELDHQKNMELVDEADYYKQLEGLRDQYLSDEANISEYRKVSESIYAASQKAPLEEYKKVRAKLDHEHNIGLVKDEEYYKRLGEIRDQYLTDPGSIDEYRKISEELYKVDEKALEERGKLREKFTETARNAAQEVLNLEENYQKELDKRAGEIANSYKLFDEVPKQQKISANELLKNLESQNKSLEEFYSNLDALAERGVDDSLVDSIRSMGIGAKDQLQALVNSSDTLLEQYAEEFGKKQEFANKQAEKELESLRDETDQKIQEQIDSVKTLYEENAHKLGFEFTEGIAKGIRNGTPDAVAAAIEMAQDVADASKDAWKINSPSRVGRDEIGKMFDAGVAEGISDGTKDVVATANDMAEMTSDALKGNLLEGIDIGAISEQLKKAVEIESARLSAQLTVASNAPIEARAARDRTNAAQNAAANASFRPDRSGDTFILRIDSLDWYRGTLESLRTVEDENPRTVDDT